MPETRQIHAVFSLVGVKHYINVPDDDQRRPGDILTADGREWEVMARVRLRTTHMLGDVEFGETSTVALRVVPA